MSEHVDIKAGISMHPSHPGVMNRLLEDEENILKEVHLVLLCYLLFHVHFGKKFNLCTIFNLYPPYIIKRIHQINL